MQPRRPERYRFDDLAQEAQAHVRRKVERTKRHLERCTPHVCRHLTRGGIANVCAIHPAAGLLCEGCMSGHVARHGSRVEFGCDTCDDDGDNGLIVVRGTLSGYTLTRNPKKGRRLMIGTVHVIGIGMCRSCALGVEVLA